MARCPKHVPQRYWIKSFQHTKQTTTFAAWNGLRRLAIFMLTSKQRIALLTSLLLYCNSTGDKMGLALCAKDRMSGPTEMAYLEPIISSARLKSQNRHALGA